MLFIITTFVTFLAFNQWKLPFLGDNSNFVQKIDFPQDTVSAQAEIQNLAIDGGQWYQIKMVFPDRASAKKLFEVEEWANNYQYDKNLRLAPWILTVHYQLKNGSSVTRNYRKADWDEVLANFVKANEQYITEKIQEMPEQ